MDLREKEMGLEEFGEFLLRRRIVPVRSGKGGKDRVTVLPDSLKGPLAQHLERLRRLFEEDRAEGVAGTWLPPPVEHKIPNAGETWSWQWLFPSRQMAVAATRSGAIFRDIGVTRLSADGRS